MSMSNIFPIGKIVLTEGVHELLATHEKDISALDPFLTHHQIGDWGDLDDEDNAANDKAVANGGGIVSAYRLYSQKIWIITEADRSVTTVLLPREY
jgi:hypothetical protein